MHGGKTLTRSTHIYIRRIWTISFTFLPLYSGTRATTECRNLSSLRKSSGVRTRNSAIHPVGRIFIRRACGFVVDRRWGNDPAALLIKQVYCAMHNESRIRIVSFFFCNSTANTEHGKCFCDEQYKHWDHRYNKKLLCNGVILFMYPECILLLAPHFVERDNTP